MMGREIGLQRATEGMRHVGGAAVGGRENCGAAAVRLEGEGGWSGKVRVGKNWEKAVLRVGPRCVEREVGFGGELVVGEGLWGAAASLAGGPRRAPRA